MQHQNSNVAKADIVWARVQFPHQFWPALVLCTDSLGVCVSFFNHNLSRCPRYVIESEVLPFEQSFRWIMGRPRKDVKKCETFYALLHSALKLMGQRVVSSLKCRCQTIPSHRDSGGGGGNSGRERFDGSNSNSCFQPNRALGFVLRVAVLPWVDEVDFVDAVRAVAQVQAFRGYCSIEQKRVYQKTQETGKDVKLLQGSSLGEKMHSVTQESVALKPKHESQIPFKQVEKNLAIGAVKRLNSGIPILKGNVSSLYENQFQIIPQTQIKNSKAEFLQEISPHLHSLTFDPFHLMGESLQYVKHGLSRFQNISEQNIFDIFFETCCKMSKPHFSIPCDIMTQLSCNFKRSKGTKTFIRLTKKRRRLDHPALCDCSFKLQKLSSFSSANEASVNKEDDSDVSILPSSSADCFSSCNKMENTDSYLASLLQSPIKLEIHHPCPNRGFSVTYMGGTSSSCKSLFKDSSFHVGFPPKDRVQETEGNALVSKHIRPCISQIKMLELDKSIQKHHQGDICSKETLGKVTDEVKQSFALESLSNSVLGAYSNNYEVDANPITIKALKGSDSTKDLRLSDTRVVSKTGGSTFESQSKPKLTNKGSDSTLDQKRTQINCSSGDKTPLKSKKSARINISSGGCLEKNENLNKSGNSYTMVNSKVGEQSKKQVSHACSKSLHMKFPKDFKLPSKWELIKKFKVFGPVDNLKTRVFSFTASAQVAFLQETDAVTAYLYAKTKKDSFGRVNVRFWLDSFEYKRESSKYSTQMSPSSKPVPLKSCLKNSSSQKKGNRKKPYKRHFIISFTHRQNCNRACVFPSRKSVSWTFGNTRGASLTDTHLVFCPLHIVSHCLVKLVPFFIFIVLFSVFTIAIPLQKTSRHPTVKWAQRSDKIYVTVDLPDAKDVKLKLEPDGIFFFSAKKDEIPYEVDLELFNKVNVEESKYNIGVRSIVYVIKKAEKKWWDRLIKQQGKPPMFLKVDWDKWVDEEEENERAGMDFDDMDFSTLDMGGDDVDMDDSKEEEEEIKKKEEDGPKKEAGEESAAPVAEEAKV